MDTVINKLKNLRENTISDLKAGKGELLKNKIELDRAIECLEFCKEHSFFSNLKEKYEVIELPLPFYSGLFSEYRVIDDCETEDRKNWIELKINGEKLLLSPGDIIIKK